MSSKPVFRLTPLAAAVSIATLGVHSMQAQAIACEPVYHTVTTAGDVVDSEDGVTSLREAVEAAVASPCQDYITIADSLAGQSLTLIGGESATLYIYDSDISIYGPESGTFTIRRDDASKYQSMFTSGLSGSKLALNGLVLDGQGVEGGRVIEGTQGLDLTLNNTVIKDVVVPAGSPVQLGGTSSITVQNDSRFSNNQGLNGGVINAGTGVSVVVQESSVFENNSASSNGGAIYALNPAVLDISSSTFDGNQAGSGGAIFLAHNGESSSTPLSIEGSTFSGNLSDSGGGAVYWSQTGSASYELTVNDSVFTANNANNDAFEGGNGSAIYAYVSLGNADITIEDSDLSNNTGAYDGGAVAVYSSVESATKSATLTISRTSLNNNTADYMGGAVYTSSGASPVQLYLNDSTLSGNEVVYAGGAVALYGVNELTVTQSTISGNNLTNVGEVSYGGGIYIANGDNNTTEISHSTIVDNHTSEASGSKGGGIYSSGTGSASSIVINHTILGNNSSVENNDFYIGDRTIAFEYSVVGDANGASGTGNQWLDEASNSTIGNNGSEAALDVAGMMGPLEDNGGPTLTHYPTDATYIIDQGNPSIVTTLTTDQRGADRENGTIDIGAVETGVRAATVEIPEEFNYKKGDMVSEDLDSYVLDDGDEGGIATLTFSASGLPVGFNLTSEGLLTGEITKDVIDDAPYDVTITVNNGVFDTDVSATINAKGNGSSSSSGSVNGLLLSLLAGLTLFRLRRKNK